MGTLYAISALMVATVLTGCNGKDNTEALQLYLGKWSQFDQLLKEEADPVARDLMLLSLAVNHPKFAPELCKKIHTQGAKEKCRQVAGRPHLKDAR